MRSCHASLNEVAAGDGANCVNSQLMKMAAIANGYTEGIAPDVAGYVSAGSAGIEMYQPGAC